jgi:hypothetical protein
MVVDNADIVDHSCILGETLFAISRGLVCSFSLFFPPLLKVSSVLQVSCDITGEILIRVVGDKMPAPYDKDLCGRVLLDIYEFRMTYTAIGKKYRIDRRTVKAIRDRFEQYGLVEAVGAKGIQHAQRVRKPCSRSREVSGCPRYPTHVAQKWCVHLSDIERPFHGPFWRNTLDICDTCARLATIDG